MSETIEVKVPDIGDFRDVPIIELLVAEGDRIEPEQSLVTLESDKATLEVPAPRAGTVRALKVGVGDTVTEGDVLLELEPDEVPAEAPASDSESTSESTSDEAATASKSAAPKSPTPSAAPAAAESSGRSPDVEAEVLVLGSGPGGYTAAFRAADLGKKVVLVERYPSLGGVCLNVGCIPSKALLHAAKVIEEADHMARHGVAFGAPKIDPAKLREWSQSVVKKLTDGLAGMAAKRRVEVVQGSGRFVSPHELIAEGPDGERLIRFEQAIIAAGSEAVKLPDMLWDDPRVMDSTDALELAEIPKRMLVVGGGIIGLEMACVYDGLGAQVTVVELMDRLMAGADADLVKVLRQRLDRRFQNIFLESKVTGVEAQKRALKVHFDGEQCPGSDHFDRLLVAVGRSPNGGRIGAEQAGVSVTDKGFIPADTRLRTNVEHIFAIGDIVGQPMLAHKASHEGKVAAEVAAGEKSGFDARVVPSVAYTDPEVAWVGVTEEEAKSRGLDYGKGSFPWAASGRALGMGRDDGLTKLLFDRPSGRIIGAGVAGPNAGDLIAECGLAIEMGCEAADIGLTVHPHPTLSETVAFAAEAYEGTVTDIYVPKRRR